MRSVHVPFAVALLMGCSTKGPEGTVPLATTVAAATSFDLPPAVGTTTECARADHSHGTPALPALGGDLTGTLVGANVVALRGAPVSATSPTAGAVLGWSGTDWRPTTVAGATPGTSVIAEASFGQASSVGTSAAFARADHTHGTPMLPALAGDLSGSLTAASVVALRGAPISATAPTAGTVLGWSGTDWRPTTLSTPAPGASVIPATSFGLASSAGSSSAFARADHTHGTPTLPAAGGDLSGSLTAATVTGLRGTPVSPAAPAPGDVLQFDGTSWSAVNAPLVVAAAVVTGANTVSGPRVGGLSVTGLAAGAVSFTFAGYSQPTAASTYVVKVTPVAGSSFYVAAFQSFSASGFTIAVRDLTGASPATTVLQSLTFMVEVSRLVP